MPHRVIRASAIAGALLLASAVFSTESVRAGETEILFAHTVKPGRLIAEVRAVLKPEKSTEERKLKGSEAVENAIAEAMGTVTSCGEFCLLQLNPSVGDGAAMVELSLRF